MELTAPVLIILIALFGLACFMCGLQFERDYGDRDLEALERIHREVAQ